MAKLVVINQALANSAHELGENWTTIGRADGNAFQIVEGSVSGRHCEVLRFPSSPRTPKLKWLWTPEPAAGREPCGWKISTRRDRQI